MSKLKAGAQAPEFTLRELDGRVYSVAAGLSPLFLAIIFKTSCPTCHYAWKYYERLNVAYARAGLQVLGISQHDEERTRNFRTQHGATFPHLLDRDLEVSRAYDPEFVPTGFLIDSQGTIVETFVSWDSQYLNNFSARVAERLGVTPQPIVLPDDNAVPTKMG